MDTMTQREIIEEAWSIVYDIRDDYPALYGIKFGWNARKSAFATYTQSRHLIQFSSVLMPTLPRDAAINTIKHELAHAIVGVKEKHGWRWQAMHIKLGGDGKRCTQNDNAESASKEAAKYWVMCGETGKYLGYFNRRPNPRICKCHRTKVRLVQRY